MIIKTFVSSDFEVNSYIVYDEVSCKAIIIDAPPESCEAALNFIKENKLTVENIILTHGHIDHIADADLLRKKTNAKIFMHSDDYFWLDPPEYWLNMITGKYEKFDPDQMVLDGEEFAVGNLNFKILHTPGHTGGGICVYNKENNVLFSGDTIFQESIGRTDLPGGSLEVLLKSITEKILTLPDETLVYPGHGDKTKIKNEKKYNPFLQNIGEE
jgi:hydroxyacylglutathione hydrolase